MECGTVPKSLKEKKVSLYRLNQRPTSFSMSSYFRVYCKEDLSMEKKNTTYEYFKCSLFVNVGKQVLLNLIQKLQGPSKNWIFILFLDEK